MVTDKMIEAARQAAHHQGISEPFMARAWNYDSVEALRAADIEAEQQNVDAWRTILIAALEAT